MAEQDHATSTENQAATDGVDQGAEHRGGDAQPLAETPVAAEAAPAPAPQPARKKSGLGLKLTLGVAVIGLLAVGGGVAALRFRDKDPHLETVAAFIEHAQKNPQASLRAATDALSEKIAALRGGTPAKPPEADKIAPAPKVAAVAPPEAPKVEPRTDEPVKPGVDIAEAELAKPEAAKPDASRPEPAKPEPAPSEITSAESKVAPAKPEAPAAAPPAAAVLDSAKPAPAPTEAAAPETARGAPGDIPLPPIRPEDLASAAVERPAERLAAAGAEEVEALRRRIAQLEGATRDAGRAAREALAAAKGEEGNYLNALEGRIDELAEEVRKLRDQLNAPKAETRVEPEIALAKRGQEETAKAAQMVVLAETVNRHLEHGKPFAREQAALAGLGADPQVLAALAPVAEKGVPTAPQLLETFKQLAKKLHALDTPADANVADKILHHAGKLVKLRPTGDAQASISELTDKIEAALVHDDLDAAAAALAKLPDNAKAESGPFETTLNDRRAAEKAAAALLSGAIDALGRGKN